MENRVSLGPRFSWSRTIIPGIFLVLAVSASCWFVFSLTGRSAPNEGLYVSNSDLDFGETWETTSFHRDITIENTSSQPKTITAFASSCSCVSIEPKTTTIGPNEVVRIKLKLDLTKGSSKREVGTQEFSAWIGPRIEGAFPIQKGWTFKGIVKPVMLIDPLFVDFGESLINGQEHEARNVTITAVAPISDFKICCKDESAAVRISSSSGGKYKIEIKPQKALPLGLFHSQIHIDPVAQDGSMFFRQSIPITGVVKEDLQCLPPSIFFGGKQIGENAEDCVVLTSACGTSFSVLRFDTDSPDITVESAGSNSSLKPCFRIRLRVLKTGNQLANVTFTVVPFGSDQSRVLTLPVSYFGVMPEAGVRGEGKQ